MRAFSFAATLNRFKPKQPAQTDAGFSMLGAMTYSVVWFKRDLRAADHRALAEAARQVAVEVDEWVGAAVR